VRAPASGHVHFGRCGAKPVVREATPGRTDTGRGAELRLSGQSASQDNGKETQERQWQAGVQEMSAIAWFRAEGDIQVSTPFRSGPINGNLLP
jgi:hypothetical protein